MAEVSAAAGGTGCGHPLAVAQASKAAMRHHGDCGALASTGQGLAAGCVWLTGAVSADGRRAFAVVLSAGGAAAVK